jgi:hypothetical protein
MQAARAVRRRSGDRLRSSAAESKQGALAPRVVVGASLTELRAAANAERQRRARVRAAAVSGVAHARRAKALSP